MVSTWSSINSSLVGDEDPRRNVLPFKIVVHIVQD